MNNNSLENEILNLPKGAFTNINGTCYVKYDNVLDVINNAYELKKPSIPSELAEIIENFRKFGWDDEYIINEIYTDKETDMIDSGVERWMNHNKGLLTKALVIGYTIFKPVWVVRRSGLTLTEFEYNFERAFEDKNMYESEFTNLYCSDKNPIYFKDKKAAEFAAYVTNGTIKEWS